MDGCKNGRSCNYPLTNRKLTCVSCRNASYIQIKGYQVYHTVHPQNTARGGSTVVIKNHMIHHEEANYATDEIQATVVTVKTKQQAITFASAYCPLRYSLKKPDYLNFLSSLGEKIMVGVDCNSENTHWAQV
jgi:exonuclease III